MAKLVSKVYGDALFSLALEEGNLDEVWQEVKLLDKVISDNPKLLAVIAHPDMTKVKSKELVERLFKGKLSDNVMGFLNVIIQKGRFGDIKSILDYFQSEAKKYKKIGVVYVTTPTGLSEQQKAAVVSKLKECSEYEDLEMNYIIDKSVLGGMRIRLGDRVMDNTIQRKLSDMSRSLGKIRI
ncbi:ATP synthase F1 subunit delta [Eubacterium xylanophilum]|uniref:ATP synthase F1 subunit delta n=1 Tax=Eubacterium xylanophilum TaxID=39497 RepID=UPI00047A93F1|nr:ATP synthase F1 subunit delta [Eubacterium xylanophilum]